MVITGRTLPELKKEYKKHESKGKDAVFTFHGEQLVVGYAKYLIEFLEQGFKDVKQQENSGT